MLNLWTLCCTMLSELVGSPVVKELNCNSKDPWFKPWCCEIFWCVTLWGCLTRESALASIWFTKNAPHRIIRGGGVWVGQKLGGWVQSWVGGSCPKYPPPSYKRSLVVALRALLLAHASFLQPMLQAPAPRWQQAPKDWLPGPAAQFRATAVIGGQVAKTTREAVVYQAGQAIKVTTALEVTMKAQGWTVALPVCQECQGDPP